MRPLRTLIITLDPLMITLSSSGNPDDADPVNSRTLTKMKMTAVAYQMDDGSIAKIETDGDSIRLSKGGRSVGAFSIMHLKHMIAQDTVKPTDFTTVARNFYGVAVSGTGLKEFFNLITQFL